MEKRFADMESSCEFIKYTFSVQKSNGGPTALCLGEVLTNTSQWDGAVHSEYGSGFLVSTGSVDFLENPRDC
jgi:hypothetical protein